YFLLDLTVILTLFGYFESRNFNLGKALEHLNPADYSFLSSPLHFLIISVLRLLLYATSYHLSAFGKTNRDTLRMFRLILLPQMLGVFGARAAN
ncbi:hypothetical protein PMAYCL1PPCAC_31080, partial [Pristionchus mayeri]